MRYVTEMFVDISSKDEVYSSFQDNASSYLGAYLDASFPYLQVRHTSF